MGFQFAQQLTAMLLSPLVGFGYDQFGFANVYILMSGLVGICLVLSWTLLRADPLRPGEKSAALQVRELPAIAQSVTRYEP